MLVQRTDEIFRARSLQRRQRGEGLLVAGVELLVQAILLADNVVNNPVAVFHHHAQRLRDAFTPIAKGAKAYGGLCMRGIFAGNRDVLQHQIVKILTVADGVVTQPAHISRQR